VQRDADEVISRSIQKHRIQEALSLKELNVEVQDRMSKKDVNKKLKSEYRFSI
jgi:hypothetical protein